MKVNIKKYVIGVFFTFSAFFAYSLPVKLGSVEIGVESFDGYQEGIAYFSTDTVGKTFEILIGYKGFGLDTVTWIFTERDFNLIGEGFSKASWWRSRLMDIDVNQVVEKEITLLEASEKYTYRSNDFIFNSVQCSLIFVRQGADYAVLLKEISEGAETKRTGERTFPVFTLHFRKDNITKIRDMLKNSSVKTETDNFNNQKNIINQILQGPPPE